MGKLYVPSKSRTTVDRARETLDRAERAISTLSDAGPRASEVGDRSASSNPLELLHLLDRIDQELHDLEQQDVDVRVEQTRFETLQRQLERRKGRFLKQAGGALGEARRSRSDSLSDNWWWHLDEAAARQRRRRLRRLAAGALAAIVLLAGARLAYEQFLAPPPEVGEAFQHMKAGRSQVVEGDLRAALAAFNAATELTPDDPEPWLWKGVLHDQLGASAQAKEAFAAAEPLYETRFNLVLNRVPIYLEVSDVAKARADANEAIDLDPTSGWGYYMRAGVAAAEEDYDAALADLERAAELADQSGEGRLQALAATQQAQLIQMRPISPSD
jgi:tetratricopeptide (TPR) repeat protein